MKIVFIIKGVSAVGKSSRVKVLIDYLETFCKSERVFTIDVRNNKKVPYGIYFEEFNTVFIGRKFMKGNIEKFNGYDDENKKFGGAKGFSEFIKNSNYSFVIEGSGIMRSNRFRPNFIHNECNFDASIIQYYIFNTLEQYSERVTLRSNTIIKDSMWGNNESFMKEILSTEQEIEDGNIDTSCCFVDRFDVPIYDFGKKFLSFYNMEEHIVKFIQYCKEVKYEQVNLYKNWK